MRLTPVPPFFSTALFSALAAPRELLIRQLSLFVSAAFRSLFNQVLGHFEVQLLLLHLGATSGPALPQCALTGDSFGKLLANSSLEWPLKSTRAVPIDYPLRVSVFIGAYVFCIVFFSIKFNTFRFYRLFFLRSESLHVISTMMTILCPVSTAVILNFLIR